MKENEVPKKIYLQVCGDCVQTDCDNCKFDDLEDNVTWCKDKIFEKDVEYTRTDAFIEKAVRFIKDNIELDKYNSPDEESYRMGCAVDYFETNMFIEDFKQAMKGE